MGAPGLGVFLDDVLVHRSLPSGSFAGDLADSRPALDRGAGSDGRSGDAASGGGARDQAAGDLGDLEGGHQRGQQRQDVADRPQDESSDVAGARRGRVFEVGEDLFDIGGVFVRRRPWS